MGGQDNFAVAHRPVKHLPQCWEGKEKGCRANKSLHGESRKGHWWSGWPGAFCLKCGEEDLMEGCVADSCPCPCHDAMWDNLRAYEMRSLPWRTS